MCLIPGYIIDATPIIVILRFYCKSMMLGAALITNLENECCKNKRIPCFLSKFSSFDYHADNS